MRNELIFGTEPYLINAYRKEVMKGVDMPDINLLVTDGILYKRRGIGMFVSKGAGETVRQKRKAAFYDGYVKPLVKEGTSLALTGEELLAMIQQAIGEEKKK